MRLLYLIAGELFVSRDKHSGGREQYIYPPRAKAYTSSVPIASAAQAFGRRTHGHDSGVIVNGRRR